MENQINLAEIPGINKLIKDYLNKKESIKSLYNKDFSYNNLLFQAEEKLGQYTHRKTLIRTLHNQLNNLNLTDKQKENVEKLSLNNTVTITTGHQLNLMTGPIYFIYKILHVIKLCDTMNKQQQNIHFIPIFWMATEDHDFEEINHFYFKGKKIEWKEKHNDFVGEIPISSLEDILLPFYEKLKYFPKGKELREIIDYSYLSSSNLAEATQKLVHKLFKDFGLLFIDGNNKNLKKLLIPYIKDDINNQKSYHTTSTTINQLKEEYKIQVNPRLINFFYHDNHERHRIEFDNGKYYILETDKTFTKEEIEEEIDTHPDKFSPNALMRPVYQEAILPNVAYIGGNAEIAYWLELKAYFDQQNLSFPILIPRNSMLLINNNQEKKMKKLNWKGIDLFKSKKIIIESIIDRLSTTKFDFFKYEEQLKEIFKNLLKESDKTDSSWKNMILAQEKKQLNGLKKIDKRFHKAERLKYNEFIANFEKLYLELFPYNNWQERIINFSDFYTIMGTEFFQIIYSEINEFQSVITIINTEK